MAHEPYKNNCTYCNNIEYRKHDGVVVGFKCGIDEIEIRVLGEDICPKFVQFKKQYKILMGLKTVLYKVQQNIKNKCYLDKEKHGYAKEGHCGGIVGGDYSTEYLQYQCINCNYWTSKD